MPTYEYRCDCCKKYYDIFLTFAEYDSEIHPPCPNLTCEPNKVHRRYDNMPNLAFGNSVGAQAERNAKKIGKNKLAEYEHQQKERRTKRRKLPWYGKMDSQKSKELGKITDKKLQKIAIKKYIMEGK